MVKVSTVVRRTIPIVLWLCLLSGAAVPQGIAIEGRYWQYRGERVLLIGGWNHGHNPFIDHDTQDANGKSGVSSIGQITEAMDRMTAAGGNLLRCVLDPGMGAGLQGFDFCAKSGDRYDLNTMTGPYWQRLDRFLAEARQRKIIVQIEIWDRFDWYDGGWEAWPVSPFNPKNNVNYTTASSGLRTSYPGKGDRQENPFGHGTPGQGTYDDVSPEQRARFDRVRHFQERFVDKLLSVTLDHDNVLYSMNNEVRYLGPAWGAYWLQYIRDAAAAKGRTILCTDMFWDLLDLPGPSNFDVLVAHADRYDYFDISQTSAHRTSRDLAPQEAGQIHWSKVIHAAERARAVDRLLHMNKIYGSTDAGRWMGSADGAVEEFWRSLIAGVAGVRFHRPSSGIGLSERSRNCLRAVRKIETKVPFWSVDPRMDLLVGGAPNQAYLTARPGEYYILYLPASRERETLRLNLAAGERSGFRIHWVNVDTGQWESSQRLTSDTTPAIQSPGPGHWAAAIVRNN